ncbi:hypothetical protein MKFW12EY_44900 (plasmid) [Methylomonas koyamae]|nr:hypothetical protein MKFW12EY_44900 [Methylomonas koyamae]
MLTHIDFDAINRYPLVLFEWLGFEQMPFAGRWIQYPHKSGVPELCPSPDTQRFRRGILLKVVSHDILQKKGNATPRSGTDIPAGIDNEARRGYREKPKDD